MEINKRIVLAPNECPELISYLKNNNIPYKEDTFAIIHIYESSPHWPDIKRMAMQYNLLVQSSTKFAKEDLEAAEWMRVWCQRRSGYPQPENTFMTKGTTYSRETLCPECGRGEVQIAPFRMKNTPKWSRHQFAELNWIGDELFLSNAAKQVLETSNITGISFGEVLNGKGTDVLEDVFQLVVHSVLKPGLVEKQTGIERSTICSVCGQKKYIPSGIGRKLYKRSAFENAPDVAKTWEIFGDMHYAVRCIFVRQNVYHTIVSNNLEQGLVFEPIELV